MNSQPPNIVFHQLDWPPERVPPLIELVYFYYDPISLHRSRILRDLRAMQAVAAEFSGNAKKFYCFLTRNELVDSQKRVIYAG